MQCTTKEILRIRPKAHSGKAKPIIRFECCESFFYYFKTREGSKCDFGYDTEIYKYDDDESKENNAPEHNVDIKNEEDGAVGLYNDQGKGDDVDSEGDVVDYIEDDDDEDGDEEDNDQDLMRWTEDCYIGSMLLREIIPKAAQYYAGEISETRPEYDTEEEDIAAFDDEIDLSESDSNSREDAGSSVDGCIKEKNVVCVDNDACNFDGFGNNLKYGSAVSKSEMIFAKRLKGVVKCFNKRFGFIVPEGGGKYIFVHRTSVALEGFQTLLQGEEVEFGVENVDGRFKAVDVLRLNGSCNSNDNGNGYGNKSNYKSSKFQSKVTHGKKATGVVKWFNGESGLIIPDNGGKDVTVHRNSITSEGFQILLKGQAVEYGFENVGGRFMALDVWRLTASCSTGGNKVGDNLIYEIISPEELTKSEASLCNVVILKFSKGHPSIEEIHSHIPLRWGIKEASAALIDTRHILLKLTSDEDTVKALSPDRLHIKGYWFRLSRWRSSFDPKKDSVFAPVWVEFPRLPLHIFHPSLLAATASALGKFLRMDHATSIFSRPSVARVCVEMDVSKTPPEKMWIGVTG